MLAIPFIEQEHVNSCGAAALEMVYRYMGIEISQKEIFEKYRRPEPNNTGNDYIRLIDLVLDARSKGLESQIFQIQHSEENTFPTLKEMVAKQIPIIALQQYTKESPYIGHFRVITSVDDSSISFHDPSQDFGGENLNWSHSQFSDYWEACGKAVPEKIFFTVTKDKVTTLLSLPKQFQEIILESKCGRSFHKLR